MVNPSNRSIHHHREGWCSNNTSNDVDLALGILRMVYAGLSYGVSRVFMRGQMLHT
jgi:hypothetical protein